ncbi:hypothetical protein [Chryseobacterium limigenitum]|uniref:DKNYY family protein n=1 Tax=Chryseobacterium limigenitum TaxID=1612149 RepID=A0A1K2IRE2_9FLAO|nr:hypothetical protein [Chryseobacterium limigenitum]SFZ95005.1 hypothetical protein SAMN05216324_10893 [Chryseobacterium limigenitum]
MKKSYLFYILFVFAFHLINAQSVTFVSEKTNKPLPKVSVFGKDGSILAFSDIDGKIDRKSIDPSQEKFQIIYDNFSVATLSYSDFAQDVIKINDRVKDIEAVVIKNNKPAKYIFVKGNFNSYVTINNKLNCYTDGIVTYIFDNKTKKLKSTNVEQYRIYKLEDVKFEKKQTAMWDYDSTLEVPDLKEAGNILDYKSKRSTIKELKGDQKDQIEITGEALQKKEFALFGYRFFDIKSILNLSYEKGSKKTLRDLLEFNEINFLKLKHKSEPDYNQLILYTNFYPTELNFSNENDIEKVKFRTDNSNYQSKFWESPSFPNMQNVFSSFFKDDLKEQQNKK